MAEESWAYRVKKLARGHLLVVDILELVTITITEITSILITIQGKPESIQLHAESQT